MKFTTHQAFLPFNKQAAFDFNHLAVRGGLLGAGIGGIGGLAHELLNRGGETETPEERERRKMENKIQTMALMLGGGAGGLTAGLLGERLVNKLRPVAPSTPS